MGIFRHNNIYFSENNIVIQIKTGRTILWIRKN